MKSIKLILSILVLVQASCSKNSNATDSPTFFSGRVITENGSPLTGEITITAVGANFQFSPDIIENKTEDLGINGEFSIMYEGNVDIKNFQIIVRQIENTVLIESFAPPEELDCGTISCENIKPGRDYNNLVLTVNRLE